jgi:ribonuclease E
MAEAAAVGKDDNEDEAAKTAARSDSAKSSDRRGHGTRSAAGSVTARPNKSDEFGADNADNDDKSADDEDDDDDDDDEDDMAGDTDGDPARCVHSRMISALDTPSSVDSEAALANTAISAVAGGEAAPTDAVAPESAGSKEDDEDDSVDSDDDAIRTIMPHG